VLLHELTTRYGAHVDGIPPDLAELPVQYPDFARWQREWLAGGQFQDQLAYWRERLAGVGPLELPTDRPRPPTSGFAGATHRFALPRSVSDEVRRFSQEERVSVFITLLAAFQALLRGVSGQDDIAVGTPSAGRWVPQTEQLVGFFLNMLVIRADLSGRPTFRDLVGQVRDLVLEADANQGVPFDLLVDDLDVVRDPSRSPLFNVMFLLDSTRARWSTAGLELSRVPYDWHTSKFDLSLLIDDVDGELTCVFEYRTDLFDRETIELLAEWFETFTGKAIANPAVRL
jgi:non-ribosomal peptide synthetase component F